MPDTTAHRTTPGAPGGVCWIDLGVADVPAAVAFYRGLFGWQPAEPDSSGYRLALIDGHPVAAFGPGEDAGPPYWTVYAHTTDIGATVAAVAAAGGSIVVPPSPAGAAGTAAVVRDPYGGPLSLWQPGTHAGTHPGGRHGTLAGVELRTDRIDGTARFLHAALGWRCRPDGTVTHHGRTVATWTAHAKPSGPSPWLVTFHVDDVAAAEARATELGASIDAARLLTDPFGAAFALTRAAGR